MTQAMGTKARLAYQMETSFGVTPASPALKLCYFLSESLQEKIGLSTSQVIRDSRNPTKPVRGNRDAGGGLRTEMAPQLGTLLKATLGVDTPSGQSSPYTHTITVGDLPSLIFEKQFTDIGAYLLFLGCKVKKMSLAVRPSGFQAVSFDILGKCEAQALKYDNESGNFAVGLTVTGGTSGATGLILADNDAGTSGFLTLANETGSFQDNEVITDSGTGNADVDGTLGDASIDSSLTDPGHDPWEGFSVAALEEGGSSIASVSEIDLDIENDLDGESYVLLGRGIRQSISDGKIRVSGTLTALFDSMSLYNKAQRGVETSLEITYVFGDGLGTAGNESLVITIPELYFSKETPVIEGPRGVLYKGPFEAFYDDGAGASAIQMVLKCADATI